MAVTVHIRITGSADDARALAVTLQGLPGIEHIEEVADLMPHLDDEDSSSAGLSDDIGPGMHAIEVEAPDRETAERVRELAEATGIDLGVPIEIVDEF
ncbi:hypothetical protein MBSD_n1079 [Mizugakiibacter sediminis]|uniref:Uncharacterized protein n=1 Tax=Mizugakiibacter sediminis TaxID=1475481 RepID=A0A0K8QLQ2_9GAMM|nr:hypothetical protein [Mizugakiibacter sediminis]GAP65788.1 hypothetical protein MBSD_n1079 [Mizugakiibacter sediminis]